MNNLRILRKKAGLTIEQVAARMGKSPRTIRRWEHNTPKNPLSRNDLQRLAAILGVDPQQLGLDGAASMHTKPDVHPAPAKAFHGPLKRKGVHVYLVESDAVVGAGYSKGREIYVDQASPSLSSIAAGQVIVVRPSAGGPLLLRQFLPPSLATTNRPGVNESYRLEDANLVLVGVVMPDDVSGDDDGNPSRDS